MQKPIPEPGAGKTYRPAENADTANDTAQPVAGVQFNTGVGGAAPRPAFNPREALFRFRMRFPNLQIIPVPSVTRVSVLAANVAKNMLFPDGVLAVLFFATGPFYANFEGNAAVPTVDSTETNGATSLLIPQNFPYMLWVQGKRQISLISEQAATVQAFCYIDLPPDNS